MTNTARELVGLSIAGNPDDVIVILEFSEESRQAYFVKTEFVEFVETFDVNEFCKLVKKKKKKDKKDKDDDDDDDDD